MAEKTQINVAVAKGSEFHGLIKTAAQVAGISASALAKRALAEAVGYHWQGDPTFTDGRRKGPSKLSQKERRKLANNLLAQLGAIVDAATTADEVMVALGKLKGKNGS